MAMQKTTIKSQTIYYFDSAFFEIDQTHFRIIGTCLTGPGYHDAIHTIKNTITGESKDITMIDLIQIFKKHGKI